MQILVNTNPLCTPIKNINSKPSIAYTGHTAMRSSISLYPRPILINFGKNHTNEERAERFIIRGGFPGDFKADMKWALAVDKLVQKNVQLLKNNRIPDIKTLIDSFSKDYGDIKRTLNEEYTTKWYANLSDTSKKLVDYLSEVQNDPKKITKQRFKEIFGEKNYQEQYDHKQDIIDKVKGHKYGHNVELGDIEDFGKPRKKDSIWQDIRVQGYHYPATTGADLYPGSKFDKYAKMNEALLDQNKIKPKIVDINSPEIANMDIDPEHYLWGLKKGNFSLYSFEKKTPLGDFPILTTTVLFGELDTDLLKNHFPKKIYENPNKKRLTALVWKTAEPEHFDKINEHLENLYKDYLKQKSLPNNNEKKAKIMGIVPEIQWYFCQMMPFERGSALIGDAIARSLMEGAGLKLSRWKEGVLPDLETFVTDLNTYKSNYANLFEIPPSF